MRYRLLALALAVGLTGCQTVLKSEPKAGSLKTGQRVLVDDGACPQGQVTQVTGSVPGVPRKRECVPMPA
ncbi:DUF6719 family protein [Rhizobium halophilum]|uniref:DUF6719 family protein n=1 Tax=Rhizobium halophilum TaxID=2846852 RepID=UPI00293E3EC3|nr:DUF6719 family protein [Rhizobium halophilum]